MTLTFGSRSHEMLPSALYIMWPIHQQSLKLLRQKLQEEKHLQEIWGQGHMKCWPVPSTSCDLSSYKVLSCYVEPFKKLEVASSKGLWVDAFTRKFNIWPFTLTWGQGHTKCCPVPSISCNLFSYKVLSCYVQPFRRSYIYKKIHCLTFDLGSRSHKMPPVPSTSCDLFTYKVWSCYLLRFRRYIYKKRDGRTDTRTHTRTYSQGRHCEVFYQNSLWG